MAELKKILHIDDDGVIRKITQKALLDGGYSVKSCADYETSKHTYRLFKPDLILLDHIMPDMSSAEMAKKLRQTDIGKICPIIFVSGSNSTDIQKDEALPDVLGFIKKPYKPDELVDQIKILWDSKL